MNHLKEQMRELDAQISEIYAQADILEARYDALYKQELSEAIEIERLTPLFNPFNLILLARTW